MKKNEHHILGKKGEQCAQKYLRTKGYKILELNCRTPYGEIDIIAKQKKTLCFVEVKTRTGISYGYPSESITQKKKDHLIKSAQYLLNAGKYKAQEYRFDVLEIISRNEGEEDISLIQDAFIVG